MVASPEMSIVQRICLLIAAVFVSAQPVMACCLEGHSASTESVQAPPPCHDQPDASGMELGDDDRTCPGCANCNVAFAAGELKVSKPLLESFSVAVLPGGVAQVSSAPDVSINGATGPPRGSSVPPPSPVSLFQKLLI